MFDDPLLVTLCVSGILAFAITGRFAALMLLPDGHWLVRLLDRETGWVADENPGNPGIPASHGGQRSGGCADGRD
jgi:hypothetical protein